MPTVDALPNAASMHRTQSSDQLPKVTTSRFSSISRTGPVCQVGALAIQCDVLHALARKATNVVYLHVPWHHVATLSTQLSNCDDDVTTTHATYRYRKQRM